MEVYGQGLTYRKRKDSETFQTALADDMMILTTKSFFHIHYEYSNQPSIHNGFESIK